MASQEANTGIVVVQEAKDPDTAGVAHRGLSQVRAQLRELWHPRAIECLGPRPLSKIAGPVVCNVKSVRGVIWIARGSLRDEHQFRVDAPQLAAYLRPEFGSSLADCPGGIDSEAVHREIARPVNECRRDIRTHIGIVVVEILELLPVKIMSHRAHRISVEPIKIRGPRPSPFGSFEVSMLPRQVI